MNLINMELWLGLAPFLITPCPLSLSLHALLNLLPHHHSFFRSYGITILFLFFLWKKTRNLNDRL